jgi:chemotaxis protein MotB
MRDTGYNSAFITYDDEATWLVTYADLMTLLLVFFVLLYTLTSFEKNEYESTLSDVKKAAEQYPEFNEIMDVIGTPDVLGKKIRLEDLTGLRTRDTALYSALNRMVQKAPGSEHLALDARDGKLILTVSGQTLFRSGMARLNPAAVPVIDRMIDLFMEFSEYTINIKGHTDNIPIATRQFPSNWELSAIRATTVLKHLISRGISPDRLTATGFGDVIPLVPNSTDANRARNRRVEFVLEKKE